MSRSSGEEDSAVVVEREEEPQFLLSLELGIAKFAIVMRDSRSNGFRVSLNLCTERENLLVR